MALGRWFPSDASLVSSSSLAAPASEVAVAFPCILQGKLMGFLKALLLSSLTKGFSHLPMYPVRSALEFCWAHWQLIWNGKKALTSQPKLPVHLTFLFPYLQVQIPRCCFPEVPFRHLCIYTEGKHFCWKLHFSCIQYLSEEGRAADIEWIWIP